MYVVFCSVVQSPVMFVFSALEACANNSQTGGGKLYILCHLSCSAEKKRYNYIYIVKTGSIHLIFFYCISIYVFCIFILNMSYHYHFNQIVVVSKMLQNV